MIDLYQHQKDVLEQTKNHNRVAYYLDMGLGKTFIGSEKLKEFDSKHNLIICQNSKVDDWVEHFKTHYNYTTLNLKNKKELDYFILNGGVGVINYDLVWRRKIPIKNFTLVLDESSLIQNTKSKRTKSILNMQPENVILLSGTPTGGKYEKLWSQCQLLGWDISERNFLSQFIIYKSKMIGINKYIPVIKGYRNIDRLISKLKNHGAVFMKTEDVFDLPDQVEQNIYVESTKEYRKFKKDKVVHIGDIRLMGDTTLTKMMYERQLASQYNKHKIAALKDLIDSTEDRLIIFYNFNHELELIKSITDKPISEVNGTTKDLLNYENEENSITLIQYQSGSMGLNLQKANKIIYFSLPLSSEFLEQSKKRTHRIGQNRTCFYYYLLTKGSIDYKIYETLKMRKDYTNKLFEEDENNE